MFENLSWHRARWPKGVKTIVWCATSHAARSESPAIAWRPLGSHVAKALGVRAAAIGFTAVSGTFAGPGGGRGKINTLAAPESHSLEASTRPGGTWALDYLDTKALKNLGATSGRVLNYAKPQSLDWSTLLDGVIILREERAAEPLR